MNERSLVAALKAAIDGKTKPPGSLGRLEELALQIGCIQNSTAPRIHRPHVLVFAADHGIAATGLVNPYPQEVTAQMVVNFLNGGAAINVFCRLNDLDLKVIDAGVNADFTGLYGSKFLDAKIAPGTKDYRFHNAMSEAQAFAAVERGKTLVRDIAANSGCNCLGVGEMGIGNTSAAALLMAAVLDRPLRDCVGKGTGVDEEQLAAKIETLTQVFSFHQLSALKRSPLPLLAKVGGFEIAEMVGAYLQAYAEKMIVIVDGFISSAALLLASQINPLVLNNCVYAHVSGERGHAGLLDFLGAKPLLDLGLRLGEGTGAALVLPLLRAAVNFLTEMASFESAGISNKSQ